jgi:hypothetical protein
MGCGSAALAADDDADKGDDDDAALTGPLTPSTASSALNRWVGGRGSPFTRITTLY